MAHFLTVAEFHKVIGATRREIDTWITRKDQIGLRTRYSNTVAGSARHFSRENVLELAGLTAFVRAGCEPKIAVAYADMIVREDSHTGRAREWCVFAAGDPAKAIGTNDLNDIDLASLTTEPGKAPVFTVVHVGEVVRRVDALFLGEGKGEQ